MTPENHAQHPQIEIKNLSAGYNDEIVLKDINLTVERDDFIGLIGPNGGGKTTLLKVILGLIPPKKGSVRVMGLSPDKGRRYIGYVPQFTFFDSDFPIRVHDVVRMGRLGPKHLFKPYSPRDDEVVNKCLDWVELSDLRNRSLSELSGGQRQRVYIARALASEPEILLLDEPTISVDMEARTHIYELLHNINLEGVTILLISHDLNVVSTYIKTIGCLNRTLYYHGEKQISPDMLKDGYSCPVDLIAHGLPHRVLAEHEDHQQ